MTSAPIAVFLGLILLAACASATIVEQQVGSYDVSFDLTNSSLFLNSSASFWDESDPVSSYGIVSIVEKAHPEVEKAVIWIEYSKYGMVYSASGEASSLKDAGWDDVYTSKRVIDGDPNGILTVAKNKTLNSIYYSAGYQLDKNTVVHIDSWLPMDGETGDLLDTIHVAEALSDRSMTEKLKRDLLNNRA